MLFTVASKILNRDNLDKRYEKIIAMRNCNPPKYSYLENSIDKGKPDKRY